MALGISLWVYAAIVSFNAPKCEHVFTQVEQATVRIEEPKWSRVDDLMPAWTKWPSGKVQGHELICVKCFHKQKQVLDYGKASNDPYISPPNIGTNCCDSIKAFNSGSGAMFLKGGILQVDSTGINKIIIPATEQSETIDTIYTYYHTWIGPRKLIDSAYTKFLREFRPNYYGRLNYGINVKLLNGGILQMDTTGINSMIIPAAVLK